MKLSNISELKQFCESLHSNPDWREVAAYINKGALDFEVDNVRFIHEKQIQRSLEDMIAWDPYTLGAFAPWAIADATGWPIALIEAAQKGEQYEEIGKAMTQEHIANLAESYALHDGYGHAFNSYDGDEEELIISFQEDEECLFRNNLHYHVFDNH